MQYYIIDKNNFIQNIVMAESEELALLGVTNCIAVTELQPQYLWPVLPTTEA